MNNQEEEQPRSEERPEQQPEEKRPLPLAQSLSCGVSTFLAAGIVDAFAHLGPTGLVVGGIAAYAASRHGPQLLEQVRGAWPARPSYTQAEAPRTLASESGGRRSFLDRALGRFPTHEETGLEDAETIIVDEPDIPAAANRQ